MGDSIYEAIYLSDKKEPKIYVFEVNKGKACNTILSNFKDENWNGYKKTQKYKTQKFLEAARSPSAFVPRALNAIKSVMN